jgi:hypothetical protein
MRWNWIASAAKRETVPGHECPPGPERFVPRHLTGSVPTGTQPRVVTRRHTLRALEVLHNLPKLAVSASADWIRLRNELGLVDDILTLDRPAIFPVAKDRPILCSALAWADVLLTLDRGDFGALLGHEFYGLAIRTPGAFLERERAAGRLRL